MPNIECRVCKNVFYAKPSHLERGWSKCCSINCRTKNQLKGKFVLCEICGKSIWKMPKDLRRSKSGKFFCNKSCQSKWRNTEYSGEKHKLWNGGINVYRKIMIENKVKPNCKKCKEKNFKVLIVHHIDSNRRNNNLKNLVWLCRNCHYLVHGHNESW